MTGHPVERIFAAAAIVAVWVIALITAEVVALIVGTVGCVTGSLALYKAITALTQITRLEEAQSRSIGEVTSRTEVLEESMKEISSCEDG